MYQNYKKSGTIHKIIQKNVRDNFEKFNNTLEIVEFIEDQIKTYSKYDKNEPLNAGIAFPVGISINDVAAHDTPSNSDRLINKDDLLKIDYGVHINGCISDGAFSICPSGKYDDLIKISEGATNIGIKNSGPDCILGEIGGYIQEYIESKEIIIDNTTYQIKSIYDLSGHNMSPYIIHLNKAVPNIKIPYYERMKEDEVFAIETFPTTGSGDIYNCSECNHFMIEQKNVENINEETKKIYDIRKTLAFCPRWFDISDDEYISKFPILKTIDGGIVSQYEKTIYVKDNGIDVIN
jgi:methionyl aminopeptidase